MTASSRPRVLAVGPMPPEKIAYALARYSRSPDSITDSIEWVRSHDSARFLESFYFQYGHASIADLGHLVLCLEGISELAATEVEDEQLWDGQARSSRYQDFGRGEIVTPPELSPEEGLRYQSAGRALLRAYESIHQKCAEYLRHKLPRPENMKPDAYARNIAARALDVARYCLFLGVPTGVGQVVSIRTLERQIRRLRASGYLELQSLGDEMATACSQPPHCQFDGSCEPLAPTLAKYVDADTHFAQCREDLRLWAAQNLPAPWTRECVDVDLLLPRDTLADITATLLYPVTNRPYRELYEIALGWKPGRRMEVVETALKSRSKRDELLRGFRTCAYVFDLVMDIGAYRDLHRHRRCQQFRQEYGTSLGFAVPDIMREAGVEHDYSIALKAAHKEANHMLRPGRDYILPFGTRSRFLFKMDFAEAEYIIRLRSGIKGHFSYREIAWKMREALIREEPELGNLLSATPPWVEDPLQR